MLSSYLAGCGNGGFETSSPLLSGNTSQVSAASQTVAINIKIGAASSTGSTARQPQYISPNTNGVLVQVYASPKGVNSSILSSSLTDVSPGSAACGGAVATRTCTITIPAPPGIDDFVFTTYDQAPVSNAFASSAKVLAVGFVTQTIVTAQTNVVNVSLSGSIASLKVVPTSTSLPGGSEGTFALSIAALDADGYTIIAGTSDPYSNPITVTVSETGGSGFTSVTTGGANGTGTASITLSQSNMIATVLYDGGGNPGYSAQLAVTSQGVTSVISAVTPLIVSPSTLSFNVIGQTTPVTISEAKFTGSFQFVSDSCAPHNATANDMQPLAAPSGSAILSVTSVGVGSCGIVVTDGLSNVTIFVSVAGAASTTITIPGAVNFNYTGAAASFSIPVTGPYHILTFGAQGGNGSASVGISPGGLGAEIAGDFTLTAGDRINVYVGGAGFGSAGGGGGGGTFIYDATTGTLLMAAGGGGGGGWPAISTKALMPGGPGQTMTTGQSGSNAGGANGNGGSAGGRDSGGGGGGYLTPGSAGQGGDFPGDSGGGGGGTFPGLSGGTFSDSGSIGGGFGGGGGPSLGGGGGGGYSGGGGGAGSSPSSFLGGSGGGGGGSYVAPAAANGSMQSGVQSGNGQASITQLKGS